MSSRILYSQLAGMPSRQGVLSQSTSSCQRGQVINTRENLDTEFTIQTKNGDRVTFSLNMYSQMDAFLYNSEGVIRDELGIAAVAQSYREVTLLSGQSLSFTVDGDLSEDELADIESFILGLDEFISEVTAGDMDGSLEKAFGLNGYGTFSSFSADIQYQRSYAMSSVESVTGRGISPATGEGELTEGHQPSMDVADMDGQLLPGKRFGQLHNFESFFNMLLEKVDSLEDKLLQSARKPINALFEHHLDGLEDGAEQGGLYQGLEKAMIKLDSAINKRIGVVLRGGVTG